MKVIQELNTITFYGTKKIYSFDINDAEAQIKKWRGKPFPKEFATYLNSTLEHLDLTPNLQNLMFAASLVKKVNKKDYDVMNFALKLYYELDKKHIFINKIPIAGTIRIIYEIFQGVYIDDAVDMIKNHAIYNNVDLNEVAKAFMDEVESLK